MAKALIAMSGGVDSSVAAYLCVKGGYDCMGVTMKLYANKDIGLSREHTCCSLSDTEDARSVAFRLGIPYRVFNFSGDFADKVIRKFIATYEAGATPNPCIDCNRYLKFGKLFQRMRELEYDYVATGHYARIRKEGDRYLLLKGLDGTKDQSYVLYGMTQEELAHTLFPLGEYRKSETRKIAEENGFLNAKKHDSQDICFVPDGDYGRFIENYTGKTFPPGNFVDGEGRVLGKHRGIQRYTVGQRKGLGLALPEPLYVRELRLRDNTVVLGRNEELFSRSLNAGEMNWIAWETPPKEFRIKAKVRYRHPEQWATVTSTGPDTIRLVFDEPQRAITAGQAVVLYDGDTVLGGGTIQLSKE